MDISLYYVEQGSGEPLVLLHGNDDSHAYFTAQIPAFAKRYHVYAVDTRGHGSSPRGEKPFSLDTFADDLRDFFDEHGLARAHVLGFSDGGNIALLFALKYPDRVDKLILDGANLDPDGVERSAQIAITLGYRAASLAAKVDPKAKRKVEMLGLMVNEPHIDPASLASITAKTLVMAGTRDLIREEHTRLIASSIPHARLAFLEGDHFIAAASPDEFNRTVLDFLAES